LKENSLRVKPKIDSAMIFLVIVIVALCVVSGLLNPRFFTVSNFLTIFQQVAVLGILTSAMLMLLITGMLDLSYGSLIGLCSVVLCNLISVQGANPWAALLIMFLIAIGAGALNGFVVTRFNANPLIVTIGTSYIYLGFAQVISKGTYQSIGGAFPFIGTGKVGQIPMPMIVLLIVLVLMFIFLRYTPFGRKQHIIGGNAEVAFLSGIPVVRYKMLTFILGCAIAGVAAFVLTSRIGSALPTNGSGYELNALAAAIIGGASFQGAKGTVPGAFLGVLLLGIVNNALNILGVDAFFQTVVLGVIIVITVIVSNLKSIDRKLR
jgi:ribose/xylose/arabinose/galactoside ABC-type transport system permease subunit